MRNPDRVYPLSVALIGGSFGCTVLAWLAFYLGVTPESLSRWSVQPILFGRQIFVLDELSAPIVPTIVLLHLLTAVDLADVHQAVFFLVVNGEGNDPSGNLQLQGTVDFGRLADGFDSAAFFGITQPPSANTSVCDPHGVIRDLTRFRLVGGDVHRRIVHRNIRVGSRSKFCLQYWYDAGRCLHIVG